MESLMPVRYRGLAFAALTLLALSVLGSMAVRPGNPASAFAAVQSGCSQDDSGLKLPPGFCATVFADGIGHARHLVVAQNGVVYVNTWSGAYYPPGQARPKAASWSPCRTSPAREKPT